MPVVTPSCSAAASSLQEHGYAVLPGMVSASLLADLRRFTDERLDREDEAHFTRFRHHGSMLMLDPLTDDAIRRLVTLPAALRALADLGYPDPRWLSAYLISKPARSPSLWWHQDWWAWDDEVSFAERSPQLFVMYYLCDVHHGNGALRVIPGSHRRAHPLHRKLPEAHAPEIERASPASIAHERQPDEVTVEVRAGDAVVGDVRLLHCTHPNHSSRRRTCLTLWYLPCFQELTDAIKAYVIAHPALPPAGWWEADDPGLPGDLRSLLPVYEGTGRAARYNRRPPDIWPS
jgi:ectoine hydroxylase-related dioxygenase (phytanoyl-CoA dioxygenase family)